MSEAMRASLEDQLGRCSRPDCGRLLTSLRKAGASLRLVCVCCDVVDLKGTTKGCPHSV